MAFPFGGSAQLAPPSAMPTDEQSDNGPDLQEISTEGLGFQSLAGEAKLQLLTSPWPSDALPPPSASLLSIAPQRGLLAAAGPESVVVASTESIRQAYTAPGDNVKTFIPQLTLNLGMRISQVAFSADEEFLVLSAELGGGLAVYEVHSLMQNNTQTAFEMSTNNVSVRALLPNPMREKADLLAVVTADGQLMMANLKSRQFLSGTQGPVLKEGVSCASWSKMGKQLVAGLGDGSCFQMTPEGEGKAQLPSPSGLDGGHHVSAINWLETDVFLTAYTPNSFDPGMPPTTLYYIMSRTKQPEGALSFRQFPELSPAFGLNRSPPSQFICRLRDFPPHLKDAVFVASPASVDISLVTRSETPLTSDVEVEKIVNVFTSTQVADFRRAQLPLSMDLQDTSPVGVALDLSSKEKVKRPLPGEEYEESPGPLPALMVLNNEGMLSTWWFVYAESIRQGTTFPGLAVAGGNQASQAQSQSQVSPLTTNSQSAAPIFRQNPSVNPSAPASPFGAASGKSAAPTFGSASTPGPGFGAPSALGQFQSSWVASSNTPIGQVPHSFGKPAFESSTPVGGITQGTAFGMAGGMANRGSVWGTPTAAAGAGNGSTFGQPAELGSQPSSFSASTAGAFGSTANTDTSSASAPGGFASFANKPTGFAAVMSSTSSTQIPFGKPSTPDIQNPFGKPTAPNPFGSNPVSTLGQPEQQGDSKSIFGGGGFKLGSTFQGDGSAVEDGPKPSGAAADSLFDKTFGSTLGDPSPSQSKDEDMDEGDESTSKTNAFKKDGPDIEVAEPAPTLADFGFPQTGPPRASGLFGTQAQSQTTPAQVQSSKPVGFGFADPPPLTDTPKETPKKNEDRPKPSIETSPKIKEEPESEDNISPLNEEEKQQRFPGYDEQKPSESPEPRTPENPARSQSALSDIPLPPESTSKTSYTPGDSSNSSKSSDDAPAQSDSARTKSKLQEVEAAPPHQTKLPDEETDDFEEESGEEESGEAEADEAGADEEDDGDDHEELDVGEGGEELEDHDADEESDEEGQDEPLDDEGSGVDVAQEISPASSKESSKLTPGSSFGMPPLERSSPSSFFSYPANKSAPQKLPLFGEMGQPAVPLLPGSAKPQRSPRSPSPVRLNAIPGSLRPDNARSVSAPGPTSPLSRRRLVSSQVVVPPKPQHTAAELRKKEQERLRAEHAMKAQEEDQPLDDQQDDEIQRVLESNVEGTKTLDKFIAHEDYVGAVDKPGIPGQIEKVVRDINSMIDVVGLNARSVASFVKGHQKPAKPTPTRADLEGLTDWSLIDIEALDKIQDTLEVRLVSDRLSDVPGKLDDISNIRKDLSHLRHDSEGLGRAVDARKDTSATEAAARAPLSLDQSTQLQDLRKAFNKFQVQLAEAEEGVTLLRTKLAFAERQANGTNSGKQAARLPTVEAVENTIRKMTGMIEKKGLEVDSLSSLLDDLSVSSPVISGLIENTTDGKNRSGSPNSASKKDRKSRQPNGYHPTLSMTPHKTSPLRKILNDDGTPRKGANGLSKGEVDGYRAKLRRKKKINQMVRDAFENGNARVRALG